MTQLRVQEVVAERAGQRLFGPLSLELGPGQMCHIQGDNGAGKTTLLRIVAGLSLPSAGRVLWQQQDIQGIAETYHGEVVYLGHQLGLKSELTAIENLQAQLAIAGQRVGSHILRQALGYWGLQSRAEVMLHCLSQGQKRRVALARLYAQRAAMWILDEPFVALDAEASEQLLQLLQNHVDQGGILIFTSHQALNWSNTACTYLRLGA